MKKTLTTDEQIRLTAYQIWEREGRPEGRAEQHWNSAVEALASPARIEVEVPATSSKSKAVKQGQQSKK